MTSQPHLETLLNCKVMYQLTKIYMVIVKPVLLKTFGEPW